MKNLPLNEMIDKSRKALRAVRPMKISALPAVLMGARQEEGAVGAGVVCARKSRK